MRILHIMKDCTDFSYSFFIPFYLEKEDFDNLILAKNVEMNYHEPTFQIKLFSNIFNLFKEISGNKYDLVIFYHFFGSPLMSLILVYNKIKGIKSIAIPDIPDYALPRFNTLKMSLRELMRHFLYASQIRLLDKIICLTLYEKEPLEHKYPISREKLEIIPLGTELHTAENKTTKENYILTVSKWWHDRKNLHSVLKVYSEIAKIIPCKLVVVGNFHKGKYYVFDEERHETGDEYRIKIMMLIDELNLQDSVKFLGEKTSKELVELYKKASVFYLPSKNETFGLVFIEAMACGTPIIAMKNSAVQYVVKDGLTGFLRNTEEEQKEAILKLLTDDELYKEMQKNSLQEAEKYKWENIVGKWKELINNLVIK